VQFVGGNEVRSVTEIDRWYLRGLLVMMLAFAVPLLAVGYATGDPVGAQWFAGAALVALAIQGGMAWALK
jgi:hypothetical protein